MIIERNSCYKLYRTFCLVKGKTGTLRRRELSELWNFNGGVLISQTHRTADNKCTHQCILILSNAQFLYPLMLLIISINALVIALVMRNIIPLIIIQNYLN